MFRIVIEIKDEEGKRIKESLRCDTVINRSWDSWIVILESGNIREFEGSINSITSLKE